MGERGPERALVTLISPYFGDYGSRNMDEETIKREESVKRALRVLYAEAMISTVGVHGFSEKVVENLVEVTFEKIKLNGKLTEVFNILEGGEDDGR